MELGRTFSSMAGIMVPAGRWMLVVWITLLGACTIPVAYYDATTYRNLTEHKAEMMTLVESFDALAYSRNEARIDQMRLAFRKAYEYELGKGKPNSDTVKQFAVIKKLFEQTVSEYRETRPGELGRKYFQESAVVIGQAFDIAITTENEKNIDKR